MTVLVTGAGGFIGGHLAGLLLARGQQVRCADIKPESQWWQWHDGAENLPGCDLAVQGNCERAADGCDVVYHLAADMGGRGFIDANPAECMLSVIPTAQMLRASAQAGVSRFLYASSACVYSEDAQRDPLARPLREDRDTYPAMPDGEYGWEKLFSERMTLAFGGRLHARAARYHGIFGPHGSWCDGREKAPAAICRKVARAAVSGSGEIEVWGDGEQTRTFLYVSDAAEATMRIAEGGCGLPLNVGSDYLVTIRELAEMTARIAGVRLRLRFVPGPQGPRGRSSDNTLIGEHLGWQPRVPLADGLERTYRWVYDQVRA